MWDGGKKNAKKKNAEIQRAKYQENRKKCVLLGELIGKNPEDLLTRPRGGWEILSQN
jgi:hypothetical protein